MSELDNIINYNPSKTAKREPFFCSPKLSELAHSEMLAFSSQDNCNDAEEKDIVQLLKDLGQESKMLYISWTSQICESTSFEDFCSSQIDNLIKEVLAIENNLKKQKEYLCRRVTQLSKALLKED
ncbi:testis-expressed protein 12-like isoform X2 [Centruroides vittatus]|uniref:testis-expressed protein 12-like isoform X2 n=1 Tax=Centruroides vittatus TaxID=120091 RepID=UPI00350FAEF2